MIGWLFFMTMGEKRGNVARRSFFGSKVEGGLCVHVHFSGQKALSQRPPRNEADS